MTNQDATKSEPNQISNNLSADEARVGTSTKVGPTIEMVVSNRAGERLTSKPGSVFTAAPNDSPQVVITETACQSMIGFGASFCEAGMICLNALDDEGQESVLAALFNEHTGAGFSAMKTAIAAHDFMSAGSYYTYADQPNDLKLTSFSIVRDLEPNGLVTYIKRARKHGKFALSATMDFPPDWMLKHAKTDQNVAPVYYPVLAQYLLRYVQAYAEQGIEIDYLSPFNEPTFSYTKIAYSELRDFIKFHLGPLFDHKNVKTAIQVSDAPLRAAAAALVPIILDDPEARRYIRSISYHGYDFLFETVPEIVAEELASGEPLDAKVEDLVQFMRCEAPIVENGYTAAEIQPIAALAQKYPDIPLWMTEVCYMDMFGLEIPWQVPLPRADFEDGEFWGLQIAHEIEAGASGWTYFNMILDENGGPALSAPEHAYPERNIEQPVLIINRQSKGVTYTGLYFYLAHFSRFVRPGSIRLKISGETPPKVKLLAFLRQDGKYVAVVINASDDQQYVSVGWSIWTTNVCLTARSITTLLW